jgi:hypothetical protein
MVFFVSRPRPRGVVRRFYHGSFWALQARKDEAEPRARVLASAPMTASTPVVDVAEKTVTHEGTSFYMRPLGEDEYTVCVNGAAVGRAVFSFGAANAVVEGDTLSEDTLTAVAEAWFAAIEEKG